MTIKPLALRRTPFGWDYEDSVTPEMRTSFNLYSMYLTGASPLPPETRLSSASVSSRSLFVTASYEVSLVLLMIYLHSTLASDHRWCGHAGSTLSPSL